MRLPISARLAIEHSDARLGARVRQIRELEGIQRELSQSIRRLGLALRASSARGHDDLVHVAGGLEQPASQMADSLDAVGQQQKIERTWSRVVQMAAELDLEARRAVGARMREVGIYRRCEVESRLEQLQDRLIAVSQASSTMVAQLGRQIQAPTAEPMPA
jgi:hypothetical protein